jgi:hydroxymethylglutaryl-CoA reductase
MELHARNLAASAGARSDEVDRVVERLLADHQIRFDRAKAILEELRHGSG